MLHTCLSRRRRSPEDVVDKPAKTQFEAFLDEHRGALDRCLDGLTEEQVRRSLVPSRTTLLGLVKHATFVEKVWFDEAVSAFRKAIALRWDYRDAWDSLLFAIHYHPGYSAEKIAEEHRAYGKAFEGEKPPLTLASPREGDVLST